jgi:hypothetical protein
MIHPRSSNSLEKAASESLTSRILQVLFFSQFKGFKKTLRRYNNHNQINKMTNGSHGHRLVRNDLQSKVNLSPPTLFCISHCITHQSHTVPCFPMLFSSVSHPLYLTLSFTPQSRSFYLTWVDSTPCCTRVPPPSDVHLSNFVLRMTEKFFLKI